MLVLHYPRCSTCKQALKQLKAWNYEFKERDIKVEKPSVTEIKTWHLLSSADIKKLFNTSGLLYKNLGLKDKLSDMSMDEKYELLASDGMLLKRPIIVFPDKVFFGFGKDVVKYLEKNV